MGPRTLMTLPWKFLLFFFFRFRVSFFSLTLFGLKPRFRTGGTAAFAAKACPHGPLSAPDGRVSPPDIS
jgi:hypothetical protein